MVAQLDDANDIDDPNHEDLINFVNRHFAAEMPRFDGEEIQIIYAANSAPAYTEQYKQKAVEMVHMNNTHRYAMAINGCKKDANELCKRRYSCSKMISETYVKQVTNRIAYQHRMECNLKIVPYNLQMIMDWDSHINVEYSGSAYCALYLYKYCYKDAARKERIDLGSEHTIPWMRLNCSYTAESCVLWRQFGRCMDIRIILHQNHQFVHLKFAVELS